MTWVSPLAGLLLALALIPPLILLYFLKLRRRPITIGSTLLWKKSIEDLQANAPFQKLRRSLLLLLQLLALILLALSIMQPQIQGGSRSEERTVIMIDNSASMSATDMPGGATRLDEAKRIAKQRIEAMYGGGLFGGDSGETMVVAFSDRAEILARFTDSRRELIDAIDRIQPTHGESRLDEALKLARAHTANPDPDSDRPVAAPAAIELFSDGRIADVADQVKRESTFIYRPMGTDEADNIAISTLSVERPFDRPTAVEVFASLLNFNPEPVICDVQLSVDNIVRAIQEVELGAAEVDESSGTVTPGRNNVLFSPFEQPRGSVIEVANLREDDLTADNIAQIVVPPPKQLVVGLVAPGRSLIRTVLEGMSLERLEVLSPARYETLAEQGGLDAYDVIVLDSYEPRTMPEARYLVFGPPPPIEGLNPFGDAEPQVILTWEEAHPTLRFVPLDQLFINEGHLIQPAEDIKAVAEGSNNNPVIAEVTRGPMQAVYVAFDPIESNWPFQRGFVTFVFNSVEHLGRAGEGLTSQDFHPGEALTARLPANATDIMLIKPDGEEERIDEGIDPTQFSWGPIRTAGLYLLRWSAPGASGPETRPFAVNMRADFEGRLDVSPELTLGTDEITVAGRGEGVYTPLWPYAVALCLFVLMVEWWIYHRKVMI